MSDAAEPINSENDQPLIDRVADIVAAYVGHNTVAHTEIAELISTVHGALVSLGNSEQPEEPLKPAVPIRRSVTPSHIICLEDGKKFRSLKRHLRAQYDLSPEEYRQKWGLPRDYPMVAPEYAAERSRLAKQLGLGQKRRRSTSP